MPRFYQKLAELGQRRRSVGSEAIEKKRAKLKDELEKIKEDPLKELESYSTMSESAYLQEKIPPEMFERSIHWSEDNLRFMVALAAHNQQSLSFCANRLVEAARFGVPFAVPQGKNDHLKTAYQYLDRRKHMEALAREMRENFTKDASPAAQLPPDSEPTSE